MRKITRLIVGLAVGLFLVTPVDASDWVAAAKKAEQSVVYVETAAAQASSLTVIGGVGISS
jgi:hypothetical protein